MHLLNNIKQQKIMSYSILDLGCGLGYRTYQLSERQGYTVLGIDVSKKNILIAKKRYPTVMFKQMDAEHLSLKNNSFDEIYVIDVLEHVNNLSKVMKELSRVLKKKGKLIVVVPGARSEKWLLKLRPTYFKEIHHVRIFEKNELPQLLLDYGFSLLKEKPMNFIQHGELYYFFKTQKKSSSQLEIGNWRDSCLSIGIHGLTALFDPYWVFHTPLKYLPIWIVTLPLGSLINFFGNKIMPKSLYYEFIKDK